MIRNFADHASNERTFLAWVRTVVAVEGFGIAAARLAKTQPPVWTETALLVAGAVVILLAFLRMRLLRRRIDNEDAEEDDIASADALLLLLAVALFALVAVFSVHLS